MSVRMSCHRNSSPERPSQFSDKLFPGVTRDSSHLPRKCFLCPFHYCNMLYYWEKWLPPRSTETLAIRCLSTHLWSRHMCHPMDGRLAVTPEWQVSMSGSTRATLEPSCSPAFSLFFLLQAQNVPDRRCSWIQPWSGNKRMCIKATPNFKQDRGLFEKATIILGLALTAASLSGNWRRQLYFSSFLFHASSPSRSVFDVMKAAYGFEKSLIPWINAVGLLHLESL